MSSFRIAKRKSVSLRMKFSSTLQMLSLLARQISCHICGDEDEIRVISLKPPAAIMRM